MRGNWNIKDDRGREGAISDQGTYHDHDTDARGIIATKNEIGHAPTPRMFGFCNWNVHSITCTMAALFNLVNPESQHPDRYVN